MTSDRISVLEKVQGLLAKTVIRGASQAEAETALRIAQRLMVAHNISMAEVQDHVGDPDSWIELQVWRGLGRGWELGYVVSIIQKFFFVKTIYGSRFDIGERKLYQTIRLFGTDENALMAKAVFNYLSQTFRNLWADYRKRTGVGHERSRAYYAGLRDGLWRKLEKARAEDVKSLESDSPTANLDGSGALIRVQTKLQQVFEELYPRIKFTDPPAPEQGPQQYRQGIRDGEKIEIDINKSQNEDENAGRNLSEASPKCLT